MRRRPKFARGWVIALAMLAVFGTVALVFGDRQVVVNTSPSVASGLYGRVDAVPVVGRLVSFQMPESAWRYLEARSGRQPEGWFVLKPIVAGPGDHVDTTNERLVINDRSLGAIATHDAAGRPLPVWRASRVLGADEFFVYSDRIANSFDSRYFGPIRRAEIEAVRTAWVTW